MPEIITAKNLPASCNLLARRDVIFKNILTQYGCPPFWSRKNNFETLVHIILEQQVSLAAAKAALDKLKEKIGSVTPAKLAALTDEELRACYFSRQKISYARHLAQALLSKQIVLKNLEKEDDAFIRGQLKRIKGIGDWTVDVYLLFVLHHGDVFPLGDLAMVNALKEIKQLPKETSKEALLLVAEKWQPFRSVATILLWHYYIKKRNIKY